MCYLNMYCPPVFFLTRSIFLISFVCWFPSHSMNSLVAVPGGRWHLYINVYCSFDDTLALLIVLCKLLLMAYFLLIFTTPRLTPDPIEVGVWEGGAVPRGVPRPPARGGLPSDRLVSSPPSVDKRTTVSPCVNKLSCAQRGLMAYQ